jgi:hypothetical protein
MSLLRFLADVSHDKEAMQRFMDDPDGAMHAAGLSKEEMEAIKSGGREDIAILVEPEVMERNTILRITHIWVRIKKPVKTPGPRPPAARD